MIPALPPPALGQEIAACAVLGGCTGAVRAFFPVKSRAAILPDVLWVGAVLTAVQSYAAGESYAGVLRWYMAAAAFAGAGAAAFVLGVPLRAVGRAVRRAARWPGHFVRVRLLRPALATKKTDRPANDAGTQKEPQKIPKRTCQTGSVCCIIQTYQSKSQNAMGAESTMAARDRRKRKKNVVWRTFVRLFFVLLLLSMLAAYISNQVTISSKRAELDTLNEQIAQQKTENEEMQRILSGNADQITEWVARDSYNYAAPNERIFVDVTGN